MNDLGLIPARYGKAVLVRQGETIEVINTHGNQVLDTWAFNAHDVSENMSMEHTRSVNSRIYANAGDVLSSNRRRPILRFAKDTSPGRHDTLALRLQSGGLHRAWLHRVSSQLPGQSVRGAARIRCRTPHRRQAL